MTLEIIYQDEHLVAINKPHGLAVHPSAMHKYDTEFAMQALRDQLGQKVYPVHRLDKKTSGILLFALNNDMNSNIQMLFAQDQVAKTYLALVRGHLKEDAGVIDYALINNEGKLQEAITHYKCLERFEIDLAVGKHPSSRYCLLELKPASGRFHQLRKHLAHIFHPIIGDRPHGCNKQNKLWKERWKHESMLLHASELSFTHPISHDLVSIKANYSSEFSRALEIVKGAITPV